MPGLNKTQQFSAIFSGFSTAFKRGLKPETTADWQRVATRVPSATRTNEYGWLADMPRIRKWVGSRHVKGLSHHRYTLTNEEFELTIGMPMNDIADNQYQTHTPRFEMMGDAIRVFPDELVFATAGNGASEQAYDGQNFFDSDHPHYNGTKTNFDSASGGAGELWMLLDTTKPLKPFIFQDRERTGLIVHNDPRRNERVFMDKEIVFGVSMRAAVGFGFWQLAYGSMNDLTIANIRKYAKEMRQVKSETGRTLGINPNLLVCTAANEDRARDALKRSLIDSGESNPDLNRFDILVTEHLNDPLPTEE